MSFLTVADYTMKAISVILEAAPTIEAAREFWAKAEDNIQIFKDEGRDPTKEEFDALLNIVQANSDTLQKAAPEA